MLVTALILAETAAARSNGPVTVGAAGLGANCTTPSLREAIELAKRPEWDDIILISNDLDDRFFDGGTISIEDQAVDIRGGFADCFQTPSHWTIISGEGGSRGSVFSIRGHSRVWFSGIEIFLGDGGLDDDGGGIDFKGTGSLTLGNMHLLFNQAAYGGGMLVKGDGGRLTVDIESNVFIADNAAFFNGGGIHASGDVVLNMSGDGLGLFRNRALGAVRPGASLEGGYGGGMYVKAPALATVGASGFSGFPVFLENVARQGGAIAGLGTDANADSTITLRAYGAPPVLPLVFEANRAVEKGGAIYTRATIANPVFSDEYRSAVDLCVFDTSFLSNQAPDGAAVFIDYGSHSLASDTHQGSLYFNFATTVCGGERPRCATGTSCSRFVGNRTRSEGGQPTRGSVIEIPGSNAQVHLDGLVFGGNFGGNVIHMGDNDVSRLRIANTLFSNNVLDEAVIDSDASETRIRHCTIADNTVLGDHVLRIVESGDAALNRRSSLSSSIIAQRGKLSLDLQGARGQTAIRHMLASETGTLQNNATPDPTVIAGDAQFADSARNDYRPFHGSLAVDFAPTAFVDAGSDGLGRDLLGHPRMVDLPTRGNVDGPRDLGAFELQSVPADPVLLTDGFEGPQPPRL